MKIVKHFQDDKYLREHYSDVDATSEHYWMWGLGDDGRLYYRTHNIYGWWLADQSLKIELRTMIKIAEEFGPWMAFL